MRYLMLAAAAVFSVLPATAFEYSGFRSGMTVAEAQAVAAQRGQDLVEQASVPGLYILGRPPGHTMSVTFCKSTGVLFALNSNIAGGVDAFASETSNALQQMGQPAVSAVSGYTESGLLSTVRMTWYPAPGEEFTLDINQYGGGTSVSRGYSAFQALCK